MGRQSLRMVLVLGVLVTLVGGTGIFATFTDRATAGTNIVQSNGRQQAADLKIEAADVVGGVVSCDLAGDGQQWTHDAISDPQFFLTLLDPGNGQVAFLCLKNTGSGTLDVTGSAIDLVDLDIGCTGDEAANGDTTCGPGANDVPQLGELSAALLADLDVIACNSPATTNQDNTATTLDAYTAQALTGASAPLAPNAVACLRISLDYPFDTPEAQAQAAQSDKVTWRFAFDATAR